MTRDKHSNFSASSLNADEQAVDKMLAPVNIDDEPKAAKVSDNVPDDQATKYSVMPSTFSSQPSIKTFNPKDINPNFNEAEDADNINGKDWEGLEDNSNDRRTQDSNDQAQQVKFLSFSLRPLFFLRFPSLSPLSLVSPTLKPLNKYSQN